MEWVRVDYPQRTRDVFVDDVRAGKTNKVFKVSRGHHRFHLGKPTDYTPKNPLVPVTGTSSTRPKVVTFTHDGSAPT